MNNPLKIITMKKYLLSFALVLSASIAFGQTNYEKTMAEKIAKLEKSRTADEFQSSSDDFVRILGVESGQWLPYYYASYAALQKGRTLMQEGKTEDLDFYAGLAQKYLGVAMSLEPNNAENHLLMKMAYSLRLMVNPQERYMTWGTKAAEELKKAEALDPNNPRITLIKAEDTYFTPAQFGGSKEKGVELFKKALDQFKTYQPKSNLHPNWGKGEAEYFVSQPVK